ncbi:MAG: hypothetical protein CXX69_00440 [Candidatus Thalassarchaeum betae]|uniref:Uncharacterized protein n=1 Tax=Candidatus Thalassarchaeum betae TaxID=2599289 RepID=A0A2V3HTG6_9ARCH|nr:MAG: hypothetical protein CXX69_00440 [Candidatus Thalassoarchaea betae]PXF25070.1 MAG: hypothetical protein CXX70_08850 [Euryarchaeota archaeon]HIC50370.1 hypothetical protein [Candidatus Poseidoniales archaeon]HIM13246.1 hypothetical protein [Candidatus Poseidoniales archaeon]HIM92799.1 hypothetical protein [Candidatus Poseidoniales archaeon]
MGGIRSSGVGRIYIRAGSEEIDLSGSAREVNDAWLNITKQDTWQSTLSRIRVARQEAIESAREVAIRSGIPERGSAFRRLIDTCGIEKKSNVILAAIHYLRSVEKESDTPPRDLRKLISQSKKWTEEDVSKWNLSLYISRMLEGGSDQSPMLEYPKDMPEKNRYVVLTDAGIDHLEKMSL